MKVLIEQFARVEYEGRAEVLDMMDLSVTWKGRLHRVQGYSVMSHALRDLADRVAESEQSSRDTGTVAGT